MKKLVLSIAVIAGMSLFACGSSEKQAEATVEEAAPVEEVVEEAAVAVDSVAADTVAVVAEEAAAAVAE